MHPDTIACKYFDLDLDAAASARFNRQRFITITGDDAEAVAGILASVQALPTN